MKTNESIGSDLKSAMNTEMAKANVYSSGIEGTIAANEFKNAIPEGEGNKKTKLIRKPMKKGVTNKLVTKSKINKPIGKLTSTLPIMGENKSGKSQFKKDLQTDPDFQKFKEKEYEFGVPNVTNSDPFIKKGRYKRVGKEETKEQGASSAGSYSGPLFTTTKKEVDEACWKGYNQKGVKKKGNRMVPNCVKESEEKLKGGISDNETLMGLAKKHSYDDSSDSTTKNKVDNMLQTLKSQFTKGLKVELEHTDDKSIAKEIVLDHLSEDPHYYTKLKKIEATEATDSGSSGSYVTNAAWAKSTSKKDWRGKSKTQIPGGKFVQVKKKCKKFPYCNQGDIKALKIFENEKVKTAIQNISKRHNISENVIKTIIAYEYENTVSKK
jgi:hypothetical protein